MVQEALCDHFHADPNIFLNCQNGSPFKWNVPYFQFPNIYDMTPQ